MSILDGHQIDRVTETVDSLFYEMYTPVLSAKDTKLGMWGGMHGYGGLYMEGLDEPASSLVLTKDQEIISRIMSCFGPFMINRINDPIRGLGFELDFTRPMADIICDLNKIFPITGEDTTTLFIFNQGDSPEPATCHHDHTRIKDIHWYGTGDEITVIFVVISTCCYTSATSGKMKICEKELFQKLTYKYHEYTKR